MNYEAIWAEVRELSPGDHVHLDKVVRHPPPLGSAQWISMVEEELAPLLAAWGGPWIASIPLGTIKRPLEEPPSVPELLDLVDRENLFEPPAVYRLRDNLIANTWEGEHHQWKRVVAPGITRIVSINRAHRDAVAGEDFVVEVVYEIRPLAAE